MKLVLGGDVEPAVASEPHHAAGEALADRPDPRVVAVEDRGAARAQALEDLRLGLGDRVDRGEELEVDGGDARDRGHVGLGQGRERPDLAGGRHAQLDDRGRVLGPQAQQGQGQAVLVVEIALGLQHRAARGEQVRRHVLRGRLADRSGHGDDRQRRLSPHVAREVVEAPRGVGHPHEGEAGRRRGVAVDERGGGAPRGGLGEEVVAVEARPTDRDEERARGQGARVDRDPGEDERARRGGDEPAVGAGEDVGESEGRVKRHRGHLFPPPRRDGRGRRAPPGGRRRARCGRAAPGTTRGPCPRSRPRPPRPPSRARGGSRRGGRG